jgi:glutamate-ammonia-ligase adenylyltransferase
VRQLEGLAEHGYLSATAASELDEIYCRYREQTHRLALQAKSAHVEQEKYAKERTIIRNYWRELIEAMAG